jgi:nitrite reductase (NADH) small subunit
MTAVEKRWVSVSPCENIPLREGRSATIAGRQLALFNLGERFLAVENRCPHRGGPLADGIVAGQSVVCPLHAWKIDLESGAAVNHPESQPCIATFPTRVEQGIVFVEVPLLTPEEETSPVNCAHRDRPLRWVHRKPLAPSPTRVIQESGHAE